MTPTSEAAPTALFPEPPTAIAVDGQLHLFPPAAAWLSASGGTSTFPEGLSVALTDPLQRALGDAAGELGGSSVSAEGRFALATVPVAELVVGLGATPEPAATLEAAGLAGQTTTLLYDALREGMNPREPLVDTEVFALPLAWLAALEAAIGPAALGTLAPEATSLQQAGYVLGQVLDASGVPVAGVVLELDPPELAAGLFYPEASLNGPGAAATGPEGVFLLVHNGGDVRTFTFTLMGEPPEPPHRGVLAREKGLLLRVRAPP